MTSVEQKLATELAEGTLRYSWHDSELLKMGDKGGALPWYDEFNFRDCIMVLYSSTLLDFIAKMTDIGLILDDIIKVIAVAAWKHRQELKEESEGAEE